MNFQSFIRTVIRFSAAMDNNALLSRIKDGIKCPISVQWEMVNQNPYGGRKPFRWIAVNGNGILWCRPLGLRCTSIELCSSIFAGACRVKAHSSGTEMTRDFAYSGSSSATWMHAPWRQWPKLDRSDGAFRLLARQQTKSNLHQPTAGDFPLSRHTKESRPTAASSSKHFHFTSQKLRNELKTHQIISASIKGTMCPRGLRDKRSSVHKIRAFSALLSAIFLFFVRDACTLVHIRHIFQPNWPAVATDCSSFRLETRPKYWITRNVIT